MPIYCTIKQPEGFKCIRTIHSSSSPCAVVPISHKCNYKDCKLCYPSTSSSDCIYKKEIAAEIARMMEMSLDDMLKMYGQEGWRLLIKRYLEATSG